MRTKKPKCVTPKCDRTDLVSHGLCNACYLHHRRNVDLRRTTWELLEAEGKAIPIGANRRRSKAAEAATFKK